MPRKKLIDEETLSGIKIGQRYRVVPEESPSISGKVIDLDENHLVIESSQGYERVFLRTRILAVRLIVSRTILE